MSSLQTSRNEKTRPLRAWEDVTHELCNKILPVWVLLSSGGGLFALALMGRKGGTSFLLFTSMHSTHYPP